MADLLEITAPLDGAEEFANQISFSRADLKTEARKVYFRQNIEEYFRREFKISTKAIGGAQPFVPHEFQTDLIRAAQRQRDTKGIVRQILFKCRQPGGSTYVSGLIGNQLFLRNGGYAFVIAQDRATVSNIFAMYDVAYKKLSQDLKRPLKYYNKNSELVLGDPGTEEDDDLDSRLYCGEAKNLHAGVGRTIHYLHMSEVCRYPTADSIKDALIPACSDYPGTIQVIESTAWFGGGASWFRDQCDRAMAGKSEYEFHFVKWWTLRDYRIPLVEGEKLKLDVEERHLVKRIGLSLENIKWRRAKITQLEGNIQSFRLSYPIDYDEGWEAELCTTFDRSRIAAMRDTVATPRWRYSLTRGPHENSPWMMMLNPEGEFWVWEQPRPGFQYDIGADVADGHPDGDWSVADVGIRGSLEQVAQYRAHILPAEFADVLDCIGRYYNSAQLAPEVDNGITVVARLNKLSYPNIYLWRKRDAVGNKFTMKMGWETSHESKRYMVDFVRAKIYYKQALVRSEILRKEFENFGQDWTPTGLITYRAFRGHDDCVMAFMIRLVTSDDENFEKYVPPSSENQVASLDPAVYDSEGLFGNIISGARVDTNPWR